MKLRSISCPLILVGIGLLAGCGSAQNSSATSASGAPATGYFPCSLLSFQEVAASQGEQMQGAQPVQPDKCQYAGQDPMDLVTVTAAKSGAKALFKGEKSQASGPPIDGVGDEAFWVQSVIWIRKGDAYATIDMKQAPGDQQGGGLKLARIAAGRL
ncbi:MAG TPA: hypothetical protein VHY19_10845 [Steroidobacteraceae bacterium]|jgi:hypothetical protein|nr:hypothetical protein [Steroidobacteraceae bacterium]